MKKILLTILFLILPTVAYANTTVPWSASSTDPGYISPNPVVGHNDWVQADHFVATSTSATSTFNGNALVGTGVPYTVSAPASGSATQVSDGSSPLLCNGELYSFAVYAYKITTLGVKVYSAPFNVLPLSACNVAISPFDWDLSWSAVSGAAGYALDINDSFTGYQDVGLDLGNVTSYVYNSNGVNPDAVATTTPESPYTELINLFVANTPSHLIGNVTLGQATSTINAAAGLYYMGSLSGIHGQTGVNDDQSGKIIVVSNSSANGQISLFNPDENSTDGVGIALCSEIESVTGCWPTSATNSDPNLFLNDAPPPGAYHVWGLGLGQFEYPLTDFDISSIYANNAYDAGLIIDGTTDNVGVGRTEGLTPKYSIDINGNAASNFVDIGDSASNNWSISRFGTSTFTAVTATSQTLPSVFPYASTTAISSSNLTSGRCVQASTGGLLMSASTACSSGSGTNTDKFATTTGQNAIYTNVGQRLGTATSSPWAQLSVGVPIYSATQPMFAIGSSTISGTTTPFIVSGNANVGIHSSSPSQALSVVGNIFVGDNTGPYLAGQLDVEATMPQAIFDATDPTQRTFLQFCNQNTGCGSYALFGNEGASPSLCGGTSAYETVLCSYHTGTPFVFEDNSTISLTMNNTQLTTGNGIQLDDGGGNSIWANSEMDANGDVFDLTGDYFVSGSGGATTYFNANSGNVGIGTSSPFAELSVQSSQPTTPSLFAVASSTASGQTTPFSVANSGWIVTSGSKPTTSSCGSTSNVSGNQTSGDVMVTGTLVTTCTINFPIPVPIGTTLQCNVGDNSTASVASLTSTTTSSITVGMPTGLSTVTIWWGCSASKNNNK